MAHEHKGPSQGPSGTITAMVVRFWAKASSVLRHLHFLSLPAGSAHLGSGTRTERGKVDGEQGKHEIRGEGHRLCRVPKRSSEKPGMTKLHHYSWCLSRERLREAGGSQVRSEAEEARARKEIISLVSLFPVQ